MEVLAQVSDRAAPSFPPTPGVSARFMVQGFPTIFQSVYPASALP